jgi:hypothetical protein
LDAIALSHNLKVRRPEPSWVVTLFVIVAIVGYCLYTAARLRGAVRPAANGSPAEKASGDDGAGAPGASR